MKSFTDLEQSKVLKDILPPESADMRWYREQKWFTYELQPYPYNESIITNKLDNEFILPAWSLVALLDILENPMLLKRDGLWHLYVDDNTSCLKFNNPIDACVEMIEKT